MRVPKTRIAIFLRDGLIEEVCVSQACEITVIDFDVEEESPQVGNLNGEPCFIQDYLFDEPENPERVAAAFAVRLPDEDEEVPNV